MRDTNIGNFEIEKRVLKKKKELEQKTGRKVSEKGLEKIKQNVINEMENEQKHEKRKEFLKKLGIGAVATTAVVGAAVIGHEKIEESKNDRAKEQMENTTNIPQNTAIEETEKEIDENQIFEKILDEYNAKYPDTPITEEDLGIIKSTPQFLTKQVNEDGTISYIQDYNTEGLAENQEYIYDDIQDTYIVVNKADNSIILTEGMVEYNVADIKTINAKIGDTEYIDNGKNIELQEESEADKAGNYIDLKNKYEERLEEISSNQKDDEMELG